MKKRKLIFKIVGKTQPIIKIIGKTQKKVNPLEVGKALGADRMVRVGKVNIPFYYAPPVSSEALMVEAMLEGIKSVWLNEINRPSRNKGQRLQLLSFVEFILPVLKQGMRDNVLFLRALRNHYAGKKS